MRKLHVYATVRIGAPTNTCMEKYCVAGVWCCSCVVLQVYIVLQVCVVAGVLCFRCVVLQVCGIAGVSGVQCCRCVVLQVFQVCSVAGVAGVWYCRCFRCVVLQVCGIAELHQRDAVASSILYEQLKNQEEHHK